MKKSIMSALGFMFCASFAGEAFSDQYLERDGRYEINWSTGKIRFYGVGKAETTEDSMRAAEQRAWADGIKSAEKNIPILMSTRLGAVAATDIAGVSKLSKLAASTTSFSTTYFADQRVKVVLEAPIHKVTPQLVANAPAGGAVPADASGAVIIQLPKGTKPSAFVRVLDEHGREVVSSRTLVAASQAGAPAAKWFKNQAGTVDGVSLTDAPAITATSTERGVIRVASSDWKPSYERAIASGRAAFVVK